MVNRYTPEKGDLVFLNFDPQTGKKQSGRRPALVISSKKYNEKVGLALFCPITSKIKGYPFEVELLNQKNIKGVILSDQIRNLDWRKRKVEFQEKIDFNLFEVVLEKIGILLDY